MPWGVQDNDFGELLAEPISVWEKENITVKLLSRNSASDE